MPSLALGVSEYDLGNRYFVMGDYQISLTHYFKALKSKEERLKKEALFMIAHCYEKLGNMEKAKDTFEEFLAKYPHDSITPDVLFSLATTNYEDTKEKSRQRALGYINRIINNHPEYDKITNAFELKIKILIEEGKLLEAKDLIEVLLRNNDSPNSGRFYFLLAKIYMNPKYAKFDYQKAEKLLNKIIQNHPGKELLRNCYFELGQIHNISEDWKTAIKFFRKVIDHYPYDDLSKLAETMVELCYLKRSEFLYGTKSREALSKLFGDHYKPSKSLEDGILHDIEERPHIKLNIYANDSVKNPNRAIYTGNVNVETDTLRIMANKVDCDLKNKILYIKGDVKLIYKQELVIKGDNLEYNIPKNVVSGSNLKRIMAIKDGKIIEKQGSRIVVELDSGRILIDNAESKIQETK